MSLLLTAIYWETMLLTFGLLAIVLLGLLTGRINSDGLLAGKGPGDSGVSPGRVQLLLFTLAFVFQFVSGVLQRPNTFPIISNTWIALMGASHAVYLGGKWNAAFSTGPKTSA